MIDHNIPNWVAANRIVPVAYPGASTAEAHVANNHVVRLQLDGVARDADSVSRRAAAVNGDVRCANADFFFEIDNSGDVKDHDARTACFQRLAKASWSPVIEVCHHKHLAAAAAEGIHAAALSAWKGRYRGLRQVDGLGGPRNVRLAFRFPFANFG